jgi:AcrR family transcriptional regulator
LTRSESSQIWIDAGYELFAIEGPDGVQVEKLARILGRNKSGFYHHFGDREMFFSALIQHHFNVIEQFCQEASLAKHFNPDYLILLVKYGTSAFVQMQLRRQPENPLFSETFHVVRNKTEKILIPLWEDYIKISNNHDLAVKLWDIMRDLFFMRMSAKKLNLSRMQELVGEFSRVVEMIKRMAQLSSNSSPDSRS